ncbi:LysR family transcriptional regulator [Anaerocolumna sp. AGMB13020]|uniref:LysR family transcriptional regulator n=1 Tax=Anaerocolumna sp. AGMB13020 TaxID=3081750 RepID=UPI0029541A5F|nr:LysR family transcriptional regulator [Anaerocolumna sp. AGMB13020]WOO35863.1 LysR family transcriptional regulator [Anaerocolumna sp. AGMB13020]
MYINLELYRIFYITAKVGSISKAAKELFTSQPAISQSIRQLELKLGGPLFYRNARGVTLTSEGSVLYQYIEQGYIMMEMAERKYRELRELSEGQIRISACSEICKHTLMKSICEFHKLHSNIKIQMKDESSLEILRKLDLGEIDLGLFNLIPMQENKIEIIDTFELHDCFVVGEQYKELSRQKVEIRNVINNYPIIMLQRGGNTRAFIDEFFRLKGIDIHPQIELSNMDLIVEFAKNGLGVACVTKEYIMSELINGQLYEVPLDEIITPRTLGIGIKKDMPLSVASEEFLRILKLNNKVMVET